MVFFIYMGGGAQGMALSAGLLVLSLVLNGGGWTHWEWGGGGGDYSYQAAPGSRGRRRDGAHRAAAGVPRWQTHLTAALSVVIVVACGCGYALRYHPERRWVRRHPALGRDGASPLADVAVRALAAMYGDDAALAGAVAPDTGLGLDTVAILEALIAAAGAGARAGAAAAAAGDGSAAQVEAGTLFQAGGGVPPPLRKHAAKRPLRVPVPGVGFRRAKDGDDAPAAARSHHGADANGVYVLETVGVGSRLVSVDRWMDTWFRRRRERVAWRPLLHVPPSESTRAAAGGARPRVEGLDLAAVRKYAGRPYAFGLALLLGGMRWGGGSDGGGGDEHRAAGKVRVRAHYCTTLVAQFLCDAGVLRPDVEPFRMVPRDFGDDTSRYGAERCLAAPWHLGPIVYLSSS